MGATKATKPTGDECSDRGTRGGCANGCDDCDVWNRVNAEHDAPEVLDVVRRRFWRGVLLRADQLVREVSAPDLTALADCVRHAEVALWDE
jgi:hypothetical protein